MHNPQVPETLEGWSILHHMFQIRWQQLRALSSGTRDEMVREALRVLVPQTPEDGSTGFVHVLGHKADMMVIHFRKDFEALSQIQLAFQETKLQDFVQMSTSYVSVVELGLYEMTAKIHQQLAKKSIKQGTDEFERAFDDAMEDQRKRLWARLYPEIPKRRYVCFYPMNKRRGETKNWYMVPSERRGEMMLEHGIVGRQYAGRVTQIISGSIGFDDWEWGVDLFADEPLVFKKLIYEMRFDEASAIYAEFGPFYIGLQFAPPNLPEFLSGRTPSL